MGLFDTYGVGSSPWGGAGMMGQPYGSGYASWGAPAPWGMEGPSYDMYGRPSMPMQNPNYLPQSNPYQQQPNPFQSMSPMQTSPVAPQPQQSSLLGSGLTYGGGYDATGKTLLGGQQQAQSQPQPQNTNPFASLSRFGW